MVTSQKAIRRLEPTLSQSLRGTVEYSLSAAIISGELAPLTLLSVPTLAARFGVSATPVREAMLKLEKRGFVKVVKNRGFRVTKVSDHDLREIVQVRRWLEGSAMGVVAQELPKVPIKPYRKMAGNIVAAAERSNFPEFLAADASFHLALLKLTGNKRLLELVTEMRGQTRMVGLVRMADSIDLRKSAVEHHELLDLLAAGKAEESERLLHNHIGHAIGWWAGRPEQALDGDGDRVQVGGHVQEPADHGRIHRVVVGEHTNLFSNDDRPTP